MSNQTVNPKPTPTDTKPKPEGIPQPEGLVKPTKKHWYSKMLEGLGNAIGESLFGGDR